MADQSFDDEDDLSSLDRGDDLTEDELDDEEDIEEDSEDEESDEDSSEDSEEETEEEEDTPPAKNIKVPKSRLDEVLSQREEARDRAAWLEQQLETLIANQSKAKDEPAPAPKVEYDFATAEETYITLIIEGDITKANKLRREIDSKKQEQLLEIIKASNDKTSKEASSLSIQAIENDRFKNMINTFEDTYPFLNTEHKSYNEEAVETVNTLLAGYVAAGKTKTEALKLAINKVVPMYQKEAAPVKKSLGNQRNAEAVKKAVKASNSQPIKSSTSTKMATVDTTKLNISKMSEKDFSKLDKKTLSLLRGD